MDPRSLDNTSASIADIVTADKLDAVSAGIVKDDESQSLSALSEKQSALGTRATCKAAPSKRRMRKSADASAVNADSDGASGVVEASSKTETSSTPSERLKVRQFLEREAVSELDETDEFEGVGSAYDTERGAKRAIAAMRDRKAKGALSASGGSKGSSANAIKSTSAQGTKKAKTTSARGVSHTQASHAAQATGAAAKTAASSSGNAAVAGTVGGSGIAAGGGVLCGVIAFVLVALVIGQIISALFGFWDAEDKKRSMEGLPPYITYEMVEEAIRCQEEFGHPAGCTIAQIICESGQGETMSQLATRDHNLFGMKWASSFASALGSRRKGGMDDPRGVHTRHLHHHYGVLHGVQRRCGVHSLQKPRVPAGIPLQRQCPHPAGDRRALLRQDGGGTQGCGMGNELGLRGLPQVRHGYLQPAPLRLDDSRGP